MDRKISVRLILFTSIPLAFLIIVTSAIGLLSDNFYSAETTNWKTQAIGQDMINLFLVVPLLLTSSLLFRAGKKSALGIWGGVTLYLIYTFLIYTFAVHFNFLFGIYCVILGISSYSFVYLLLKISGRNETYQQPLSAPLKLTANYFVVISLAFYLLWLIQILPPSFQNTVPRDISSTGLLTNPVHVIDLSLCLPGIFLTGVLILRNRPLGFLLAPMVLVFMVLMEVTIGLLAILMKQRGVSNDPTMAFVMILLGSFSSYLLVRIMRNPIHTTIA